MYSAIKKQGHKYPVLSETADDETVIISKCEWDRPRDEVWGWCGPEEENNECDPVFVHVIGDDHQAYQRLVNTHRLNRLAGFSSVAMVNPVHKDFSICPFTSDNM